MKFYLVTIIATLFLTAGTLNAQNINIGTKIGLNSYTVNTDNNSNFDSRIGLHAGLIGHIHINDQFGLQPEIVYSMQGAKSGSTELKLDYLNIPLNFQYMFDNGFRLQAGPQVGFLLNAEAENGSSIDVRDDYKSIDAGLSFGVGYIHPPTDFGIDIRYNLGLNDISENSSLMSTKEGYR